MAVCVIKIKPYSMFDFVKVRLPPTMYNVLLNNELLEFKSVLSYRTGELQACYFAKYPIGNNLNLNFKIKGTYIELTGSLHKFMQNGTNYKEYHYIDVVQTLEKLNKLFQINPNEATVHNLEFGLNIGLEAITANELLNKCLLYGTKQLSTEYYENKGLLKRAKLSQYEVKLYDKGTQNHIGDHLLRVEKKVLCMEKLGIVTLSDLLNPTFVNTVSEQLLTLWDNVLYYEEINDLKHVSKPLKEIYKRFNTNNYLSDLAKYNYRKLKHERSMYKDLVKQHCSNSIHQQISESILDKLISFEAEAVKNYVPKREQVKLLKSCTKMTIKIKAHNGTFNNLVKSKQ
jgi:hypothetical protein